MTAVSVSASGKTLDSTVAQLILKLLTLGSESDSEEDGHGISKIRIIVKNDWQDEVQDGNYEVCILHRRASTSRSDCKLGYKNIK